MQQQLPNLGLSFRKNKTIKRKRKEKMQFEKPGAANGMAGGTSIYMAGNTSQPCNATPDLKVPIMGKLINPVNQKPETIKRGIKEELKKATSQRLQMQPPP